MEKKRQVFTALAIAATVTASGAATASAATASEANAKSGDSAKSTDGSKSTDGAHEGLIHGLPTVESKHPKLGSARTKDAGASKKLVGTHYVSTRPIRSFDTRRAQDGGPLGNGEARVLHWKKGQVDDRATSMIVNLTVSNPTADTYLTFWSGIGPVPQASSIAVKKGETRSVQVTVPIGRQKDGSTSMGIYNHAGTADVTTDFHGAYGTGQPDEGQTYTGYTPQKPSRALDTRKPGGPGGPLASGHHAKIDLSKLVPADTDSVTLNLTALNRSNKSGFLSVVPYGQNREGLYGTSSLSYGPNSTTPNQVTVNLGKDKSLDLYNQGGTVDVLLDILGTYTPQGKGLYYQVDPTRIADTRNGGGTSQATGEIGPGESKDIKLPGDPKKTMAINTTVTTIGGDEPTYTTAYGGDEELPNTSTDNVEPGGVASNAANVASNSGSMKVYNHRGKVNVIVDASGYFATKEIGETS